MVDLAFGETLDAITESSDREIGIFVIPLLAVIFATAGMATIYLNPSSSLILSTLKNSGVCSTNQPYLITSVMGSFKGDPLAHVAMCQIAEFNPLVFAAWYLEVLSVELLVLFIYESIWHEG